METFNCCIISGLTKKLRPFKQNRRKDKQNSIKSDEKSRDFNDNGGHQKFTNSSNNLNAAVSHRACSSDNTAVKKLQAETLDGSTPSTSIAAFCRKCDNVFSSPLHLNHDLRTSHGTHALDSTANKAVSESHSASQVIDSIATVDNQPRALRGDPSLKAGARSNQPKNEKRVKTSSTKSDRITYSPTLVNYNLIFSRNIL